MKCKTLYFSSKNSLFTQNDHSFRDMTGTNTIVSKIVLLKVQTGGGGYFFKKNQHLNFFNFAVILGGRGVKT